MTKSFLQLSILLAISIPSVHAATHKDTDIEKLVVTGSRVLESIDEVPASVVVIDQAQIQQQLNISSELQNLLAIYVPGMAASTGSSSNSGQTLRGRAPLIMIDGVPQSTPLRNGSLDIRTIDPSSIERIEVIKGATSIYGNGAAGGVINYITKKPQNEDGTAVDLSVSSKFSAVKTEDTFGQRVNGRIQGRTGDLSYVVVGSHEENGLQRDAEGDVLGLKYGLSDAVIENYFTKVAYDIDQDKSIQATFNYYQSQQESDLVDVVGSVNTGQKTYAIKDPDNKPKFGEPQGPKGNTNLMVKYQDANVFTDTELTVDLYKQKIENIFFYSPVLSNPEQGFDGGQSLIKSDKQGFRATLNSLIDFGDVEGTFIYGLDILNDVTSQPLVDGRVWVPEMDMDNKAGFIQTKWIIDQDWIVKAGVRKEDISLSVDNYKTLRLCRSAEQCSVPVDVKGGTLNYEATTYNAAIKYNAYEVFSPFVSYSEGADISDLGRLLRTATVTDIADIHTEASIIKNYEAGFNSQFENLRIEFSAYRSTSELGTSNKFDPVTGIYMPVRAPQKIWGIDFLASYPVTDSLNVTATHSWVEGKNTENDTHLGLKQISPAKTTVNLGWSLDAATQLTLSMLNIGDRDKFTPDENGNYAGDQGPIKGYTLFNLSGTTQIQDWTLFAGVENLLNEDYYPAKSQGYTYSGYNNKGMGTSINIGASYTF